MTLNELVNFQKISGESDLSIIKTWFIANGKELEGIKLLAELSETKAYKLESTIRNAQTWIPVVPDVYTSNKGKISKENAEKLNKIVQYHILDMPLSEKLLAWAKETIPTLNTPTVIFVPAVEWLRDKYGIEFADKMVK